MPAFAPAPSDEPSQPRLAVVRSVGDFKGVAGLLRAGYPVLVVIPPASAERQRVLDLLAGWTIGSGGELDRFSPNTVLARPPGAGAVRLGRGKFASAVDEIVRNDGPVPLTRQEEQELLTEAIRGSAQARRRLVDTYSELATLVALRIRPATVHEENAVRIAQDELERLVSYPSTGPLLANLLEGIIRRLRT
ncbi:MAG: cell division protein SepF [Acidimicrobiales bacterium]